MLNPGPEKPLCYVDYAEDKIFVGDGFISDNLPRESERVLEIHLQEFLSAVEMCCEVQSPCPADSSFAAAAAKLAIAASFYDKRINYNQ
jgi:hypothetical protein